MEEIHKIYVGEFYKWACPKCKSSMVPYLDEFNKQFISCLACGEDFAVISVENDRILVKNNKNLNVPSENHYENNDSNEQKKPSFYKKRVRKE
jgi:DNA-directed RNA polymerase subunit M/transcription elongation factor TFIIS